MGADARWASAQRDAAERRSAPFVAVLLAGVVVGLVVHLLGALSHQGAVHEAGATQSTTAVSTDVDAAHARAHHLAHPAAKSGLAADEAGARLTAPLSLGHEDGACGSLLRPSGVTTSDLSGCAGPVDAPNSVGPAAIKITSAAGAASSVARPSESPGRQRI